MALINTATGVRPDPKRYNDAIGVVLKNANLGTRVARGTVIEYDARMGIDHRPLEPYKKVKRSPHQIREIVKGLFVAKPELMVADAQDVLRHAILQMLEGRGMTASDVEFLCNEIPFARVLNAIRDMRNRDGDVEDVTGDAWWTHKKIKPASQNPKAVSEYHRRGWLTRARMAATLAESANVLRNELGNKLRKKAPTLACAKTIHGVVTEAVTAGDFDGIEATDV